LRPGATSPESQWSANEIARSLTDLEGAANDDDQTRLIVLVEAWQVIAAVRADPGSVATAARSIAAAGSQFVLRAQLDLRHTVRQETAWLSAALGVDDGRGGPTGPLSERPSI
jgi:hypothetical protein